MNMVKVGPVRKYFDPTRASAGERKLSKTI